MGGDRALSLSRRVLALAGTQITVHHRERIPSTRPLVIVSNHRSVLDVPLLLTAMEFPVRFACHHFMGQVPGMQQMVNALGCFPLDPPGQRPQAFFQRSTQLLRAGESVGIFPEGAQPMIQPMPPQRVGPFHRGVAHLALRASVQQQLAILPIAIVAVRETTIPVAPFKLFQWLAPSEPGFKRSGWHPAVYYRQVHIHIGHPLWVTDNHREQYYGQNGKTLVQHFTQTCRATIADLLTVNVSDAR